ncbi:DUF692 domain-containing protein [Sphaerisporangium fuscum]|uniref:DUF692 domain-containing protein n=1 Tax=Sphaerisporangium fuscum TaxID=2835868 RepID=UPI001BDCE536|nr:DUF692 domain-containing protein [Sphaerisporangium fuscum]
MTSSGEHLPGVPHLGSGLGYRRELRDHILRAAGRIDVLEIVTEQFMDAEGELEELADHFPVIPHGVGLSLGTVGPLDRDYLSRVKRVCDLIDAPYYSEHLAITRAPGIDIGHLSPVWFVEDQLRTVVDNIAAVQDFLGRPLVVENISYLLEIPYATMSQGEFFHRMVEATGCGVLLDVANVHINSCNHGFSAEAFLDSMPLHAVVQIHLAGGFLDGDVYIDGHCARVNEPTWKLLEVLAERVPVRVSILEQDADFPDELTPMLDDVDRSRQIITAAGEGRR